MDIDFVVHDTFGLLRPQWKVTTDLTEAGRLFAEAVSNNYKGEEVEKAAEQEEAEDDTSSLDGEGEDLPAAEAEDGESSDEEAEGEVVCSFSSRQSATLTLQAEHG